MPKMKTVRNKIHFACMMAALLLAACSTDGQVPGPKTEGKAIRPRLEFKVSEMTLTESSRASAPMSPDVEKYVKTLAIFEFDNEGLHEKGPHTYHFIDFIAGTVDGKKNTATAVQDSTEFGVVESTLEGLDFEYRSNGTICLVANVSDSLVQAFYDKPRDPGQSSNRLRLDQFKEWALPFMYEPRWTDVYDDSKTGHILDMYMFGYYEGEIKPAEAGAIRVDLGRLASRLDITIVNDTGSAINKLLGYHLDNVCIEAVFFPMKVGRQPINDRSIARTIICSGSRLVPGETEGHKIVPTEFPAGDTHTHYFYVAAHSAKDYTQATSLHIFYDRDEIPMKDIEGKEPGSVDIPLCNVHPFQASQVVNGYSLSRNTRYHFTIRLKNRETAPTVSSRSEQLPLASPDPAAEQDPAVVYGDRPGEITVYLP